MKTNKQRGDRAYRYALLYSHEVNEDEDIESAITDLIADLAHLAENDYGGGDYALELGTLHFTEERDDEEIVTTYDRATDTHTRWRDGERIE